MGRCFTVSKKDYMGENRGFKSFFYMIFFFPLQNVKNVVMGGYFWTRKKLLWQRKQNFLGQCIKSIHQVTLSPFSAWTKHEWIRTIP